MLHTLNSANNTRILHIFPSYVVEERAIILYFYLSSSQYSNDLTLLSLLGNDDDAYQVFQPGRDAKTPSKLSNGVEIIILRVDLREVIFSAVGIEQTVQLQKD